MTTIAPEQRIYAEGDPDLPEEFRDLMVRMLTHHIENSTNPHYNALLSMLWDRCMTLPPEEGLKTALAKLRRNSSACAPRWSPPARRCRARSIWRRS